jgi:hypothetical protein
LGDRSGVASADLWKGLAGLGVVLAAVGGTDIALLWWPPRFGDPNWELVIITNFLDALPVATMGGTLLTLGALARSWPWVRYASLVISALIAVAIVSLTVVYALDVPLALRSAPAAMTSVVYRSIIKTGALAAAYTVYYAWLTWFVWCHRPARGE